MPDFVSTIRVKTFVTLCVLGEENVIQVDPTSPPVQCWVLHILYTFRTSTLFRGRGVGEKNLVKAVFMSVYRGLAANSIQNQMKKGSCPKTFWPGL